MMYLRISRDFFYFIENVDVLQYLSISYHFYFISYSQTVSPQATAEGRPTMPSPSFPYQLPSARGSWLGRRAERRGVRRVVWVRAERRVVGHAERGRVVRVGPAQS